MLPRMRGLRTETLKKVGRPLAKDGSNTSPGLFFVKPDSFCSLATSVLSSKRA